LNDAPVQNDSDLDILDVLSFAVDVEPVGALDGILFEPETLDEETVETLLFTATNPGGTVSVTALMGGQILRVSLCPSTTAMTEVLLAEEISLLASMARLQALAGQHAIIAALLGRLGRDPAAIRSFLERDLGLPSPEAMNETRADVFAARYYSERE
jgi:hypothetical protein